MASDAFHMLFEHQVATHAVIFSHLFHVRVNSLLLLLLFRFNDENEG